MRGIPLAWTVPLQDAQRIHETARTSTNCRPQALSRFRALTADGYRTSPSTEAAAAQHKGPRSPHEEEIRWRVTWSRSDAKGAQTLVPCGKKVHVQTFQTDSFQRSIVLPLTVSQKEFTRKSLKQRYSKLTPKCLSHAPKTRPQIRI